MGKIANCFYCKKPIKKGMVTLAQKMFDDNDVKVWAGARDFPFGICHVRCDDKYKAKKRHSALPAKGVRRSDSNARR